MNWSDIYHVAAIAVIVACTFYVVAVIVRR